MATDQCIQKRIPRKKVLIVGDSACGKTCLFIVFMEGFFPSFEKAFSKHIPTWFENCLKSDFEVDGKQVELAVWDTAGQEEYDKLRTLSYPNTDVILVCFSIDSPESFNNIPNKWAPEVTYLCPNVPIILVGNKKVVYSCFIRVFLNSKFKFNH